MKNFAIVVDKCHANNYLKSKLINTNVIALTPDAFYFLKNEKNEIIKKIFDTHDDFQLAKLVYKNKL